MRAKPKRQTRDARSGTGEVLHLDAALLRYVQDRKQDLLSTLRHMVELESPSLSKSDVDRLGQMLAREFRARGGKVRLHRSARYGDHLQVDFPADSGSPILLLGHFDTVWETGTIRNMPCLESGGRLLGPGVFDMKAGIAQILFALESLIATLGALPRPLTVLLVSDEEVGSPSSREITESLARKSAAVLVLEPAAGLEGRVKTARKGVGNYHLKITGVPAHAGLDFSQGHSAVLELARQLLKIAKFTSADGGITVSPGIIQGGVRTNVVPAEAHAEIDVRVEKLAQAARLDRRFRSLKPFDRHCRLEVAGGLNRPPMERSADVAHLFHLAQKLAHELGFHLQETAVGGGSDGNFTAALGIPTLDGLGAVGEGAHARNESVIISELAPRTALLARLIQSI